MSGVDLCELRGFGGILGAGWIFTYFFGSLVCEGKQVGSFRGLLAGRSCGSCSIIRGISFGFWSSLGHLRGVHKGI